MKTKISNINDLNQEIARLSRLQKEQERYLQYQFTLLKHKVEKPARIFNIVSSSVPGVGLVKGLFSSIGDTVVSKPAGADEKSSDWLSKVLRIGIPLILNKTVLKNSGWLQKILVLLASESAAGQLNKDKMGSMVSKVADFIRPKKSKKKDKNVDKVEEEQDTINFGIPPESETY